MIVVNWKHIYKHTHITSIDTLYYMIAIVTHIKQEIGRKNFTLTLAYSEPIGKVGQKSTTT